MPLKIYFNEKYIEKIDLLSKVPEEMGENWVQIGGKEVNRGMQRLICV